MSTPALHHRGDRIIDLDVVRAVALIGVCVMNYHGYLLARGGVQGTGFWDRLFDTSRGPLTTRFAATFVVVAGMGVSLLTQRSRETNDRARRSDDRWTLLRRGVLLYSFGFFLDWVWPGTILFFYGAFFIAAAALCTLRIRWIVAVGAAAALAAAALQWWATDRAAQGHPVDWLLRGDAEAHHSPRELVFDTFVRGTHPLLPWLAFLCAGMALGRLLPFTTARRVRLAVAGAALVAGGYVLEHVLPWHEHLRSTHPFDRGLLFTTTAMGTSLVAVSLIGWIAERTARSPFTHALAVTGRSTLTLYVLHVLVFNLFVDWLGWVTPGGLSTALVFALAFWAGTIVLANLWALRFAFGPLEWVYRRFGG
ncbi:MAG: hypothetical protein RJA49_2816 [Actinomycetota bacterium]